MKKLTSEELAEAWKASVIPLHTAVRRHWKRLGLWPVNEKVVMVLELILGFANLGMMDKLLPVGENEEITIAEALDRYKLSDFIG